jgi:hypothetical protein
MRLTKSGRRKYEQARLDYLSTGRSNNVYFDVIEAYRSKNIDKFVVYPGFDTVYKATLELRQRRRGYKKAKDSGPVPFTERYKSILELQYLLKANLLNWYKKVAVHCIQGYSDAELRYWVSGDELVVVIASKFFSPDREDLGRMWSHKVILTKKDGTDYLHSIDFIMNPAFKLHFYFENNTVITHGSNVQSYYKDGVLNGVAEYKNKAWKKVLSDRHG